MFVYTFILMMKQFLSFVLLHHHCQHHQQQYNQGAAYLSSSLSLLSSQSIVPTTKTVAAFKMSLSTSNTNSKSLEKQIVVDPFCYRQFKEHKASTMYGGTVFDISINEFETIVNEQYTSTTLLQDGYASFCKHLFVETKNFLPLLSSSDDDNNLSSNVLEINNTNEHLLRTKYEARNDKELPVLVRYFPKQLLIDNNIIQTNNKQQPAKYLDLILYSREQIIKENSAQQQQAVEGGESTTTTTTNSKSKETIEKEIETNTATAPWGIVSIKVQDVSYEIPMNPITVMRNALGCEEGGSGVSLNRKSYMEAVQYWDKHAIIS